MATKYLDSEGLRYLWTKIKATFALVGHSHSDYVPTTRKVNNKALSADISLTASDVGAVADANYVHTDNNYTSTEKSKLAGIASGAEVNVQADWNVTDTASDAFIKNKPTIPTITEEVFVATYNSTTFTDVQTAVNAGKIVFVKIISTPSEPVYMLLRAITSSVALFTGMSDLINSKYVTLEKSGNVWGTSGVVLAKKDSPILTGTPKAPTAAAGTNDTQIATTEFVNTAIRTAVIGAVAYQGIAPTSFAPTNYTAGWYWIVGTAGTYCGQVCEAGDMIFCKTSASAYSASNFDVVQTNLDITSITNADIDTIVAS